jgi:NADPH:quinone reductase
MRAAVVRELGAPPEPSDVADPAADGEALVDVLATPLNPIDVAVGAGRFYGGHPELPYVPGCECVGTIRESAVHARGTLVWVHGSGLGVKRDGGLAERLAAPEEALVPLPEGTNPVLAGAVGIAGLAGWLPLAWRVQLRGGETVLVLGATGTVGLVALQAAKLLGAGRVVAAGRSEAALERAVEAGADATVRLDEDDLAARFREACGGDGPDVVVDPLWGEPLAAATEAAARGARLVNIGQSAGPETTIRSADVRGKQLELFGYSNYAAPPEVVAREYLRLVEHAAAGEVRVDVEAVAFERVTDAWRRQAEGAGRKLVVVR